MGKHYVGYTATPFANIFIDPDTEDEFGNQDLFPKHFIIGLDPPSNYFGPRRVILDGDLDEHPLYVRFVEDNEDVLPLKHKIDHEIWELPGSLVRALRVFVVARAIRNLRGQGRQHASMLVNASRFKGMQFVLRNRLHDKLETIRDAVRADGGKGDQALGNPEIAALRRLWEEEYAQAYPDWGSIQANLLPFLETGRVIAINSDSSDRLDYDDRSEMGQTVVAVGGLSLSRGLTLEGLTVSYFLRNSMMYDTLMQMSRWFGYRSNYEDVCRIWMRREAAEWYAHIADATEELQDELKRMEQSGATPEMFGLAVRSHPSSLMVTARNKLGAGKKRILIGLSNAFVETSKLSLDRGVLETNRIAARKFLEALRSEGHSQDSAENASGGYLLRCVPVRYIDEFLLNFRNVRESPHTETGPVREYILRRSEDELSVWDVHVVSIGKGQGDTVSDTLGWRIAPAERSVGEEELGMELLAIGGKRSRVASRGVEKIGVDVTKAEIAEEGFREKLKGEIRRGAQVNFPDRIYREVRDRPLLIIHLLKIKEPSTGRGVRGVPTEPVVAWGISFPVSRRPDERVEYILNTTRLRELFGEDDTDEDDQ